MKDLDQPIGIMDVADAQLMGVQQAQKLAEIKNASIRQAERQEKMEAWSDPEAMAYRKILHDKKSFESLQYLKASGNFQFQVPLPPDSELPKEMRGQQPSTIRNWMRDSSKYRATFDSSKKDAEEKDAKRNIFRTKYPEMFGIDDAQARVLFAKEEDKDPFKVRGGKPSFTLKDQDGPRLEKPDSPGLISRVFAGLFGSK